MSKDHKAEYGYQPNWSRHREKQREIAEARDEKRDRKLREMGLV